MNKPEYTKQDDFKYQGNDLEAMIGADNYYAWILRIIQPYVGNNVIEVGAGVGSFSKLLLKLKPSILTLIEPSNMFGTLKEKIQTNEQTEVQTINGYLQSAASSQKSEKPDTIVYINVMEHIKDDASEIKNAAKLLKQGGTLIIFVPAFQQLYSNFDKSIDHYRRYTKSDLQQKLNEAGLEVEFSRYMDMIGMLPWWISFVMMKRTTLVPTLVKIYDRVCIPIIRIFESSLPVPVGKNVLVIARKK